MPALAETAMIEHSMVGLDELARSIDRLLMLAFPGTESSDELRSLVRERDVPGFTLFPGVNVREPGQVRELTDALQSARGASDPLLFAIDQEGGQLLGLKGGTPFAGNMALGAVGDEGLAERVGLAIGRELRAAGVNVNYAPVSDVATDPDNPSLGIRSFGDDPGSVGRLAAATVRGLQVAGVAATLKHFPGKGAATVDPHHELPVLSHDLARLRSVDLVPFRAGVEAGARMVMVGHYDLPQVTGRPGLPSSLSARIVHDLLREELGHAGVVITDALDMRALPQGEGQPIDAIAAVRAGADLLLFTPDEDAQRRVRGGLALAVSRELVEDARLEESGERVRALRWWAGAFEDPPLDVVGCAEHRELARELAERSITLVRGEAGLLPLRLDADARIAAIVPAPKDLTPADTSSSVAPTMDEALRRHHPQVDGFVTGHPPTEGEIASLRDRAGAYDAVVVGTIEAWRDPGQPRLVDALVDAGVPVIAVALRTPHDLVRYPRASTYVCAYGILPPSMDALASALFGRIPFRGRLPAAIPSLYHSGHGIVA